MKHRFFHAFKWQTVVDTIKKTKGIVLIAATNDGDKKILAKLTAEDKARTIGITDIYDSAEVEGIIWASNKPSDMSWVEWHDASDDVSSSCGMMSERTDTLGIACLVIMDHGNRTPHLHKIIAETTLTVISSTEQYIAIPKTGKQTSDSYYPDVKWLYGRPSLPDFDNLTDEVFELYKRDDVSDLDSLIPVYDFSVQSFSHKQLLDAPLKKRTPLVLLNGQPLLRAESITQIFAWRGTGKTMFSLGLAAHLAAGKSMPGLEIPAPCKVLYVEGELPASQLQERYRQLSDGLDIPDEGITFIGKSLQQRGMKQAAVTINTEAGRLVIESEIEKTGAEVLFIDSIASLAKINTNNEEAWLPIIQWMVDLRCKGICVVYLQQTGKGGEQRGHSVSEDRIDLAIRLTATNSNPKGAAFKMTFTKEREGSLTPLSLHCTKGVWSLAEEKAARAPEATEGSKERCHGQLDSGSVGKASAASGNSSHAKNIVQHRSKNQKGDDEMTALTLKVKPTDDGGFEIEFKPTQVQEPEIVEMPYTCMPGARRRQRNIPVIV